MVRARSTLLLRDYISRALYDRGTGYFTKEVVNSLSGRELPFRAFGGEKDYRMALAAEYASAGRACAQLASNSQQYLLRPTRVRASCAQG